MKKLNKNILAIGIATAMSMGTVNSAEMSDVKVSGFVDVIYTATNDGQTKTPPTPSTVLDRGESQFLADGEIDFVATVGGASVVLDVDVYILPGAVGDAAQIEQAHIAVPIGPVTLIAGVFNNPIGYEAEDAPDLDFTSHNIIYNILDDQTTLHGNNLAGAAVAFGAGPATVTLAFVNDIGQFEDKNSVAAIVNLSPLKGLDLEIGYVTQDDSAPVGTPGVLNALGSAGDVLDLNAVWSNDMFAAGFDYMSFSQLLDPAMVVWAGVNLGDFNFKARFETVAADAVGAKDAEQVTLYGSYPLSKNTSVALEVKDGDIADSGLGAVLASSVEGSLVTVEFIGTF